MGDHDHDDDPVDDTTPVLTQAEAFMLGGYLADAWGGPDDNVDDIEEAIRAVLARDH